MDITGLGSLSGIAGTENNRSTIAENFDTFLQLLTTQLQNQNPLDPLDTNQFTQQLVQFTEVEQSLKTNEQLETMLLFQSATMATAAVSYIGKTVTAEGNSAELSNGFASWSYELSQPAPNSTVTIRNENGEIVFSEQLSLEAGTRDLNWDGRSNDGTAQPDGIYKITIDARDGANNPLTLKTSVNGIVDSVDLSEADPVLVIGSKRINLSTVTSISG